MYQKMYIFPRIDIIARLQFGLHLRYHLPKASGHRSYGAQSRRNS